jgi:poly(hydroxyalkanoate) depolymerase family esterase
MFQASLKGDLYTPTTPAAKPAILVVIHMCTGHSTTVHGWFDSYADTNGFYLIAPDAGKQCFDSSASRDGDKAAIVSMVNYLITNKGADKTRVFAAGMSSGGCMTNTLLAIYPDVFAGGSAMPGFPAGGWPAGDITCTKCGSQPPNMTGQQWGDLARKVFSWSGQYPCSQQWVGGGDQYNFNGWLPSVAAQFQNLGSLGAAMSATGRANWTRTVYKDSAGNVRLQTNLGPTSQMHDLETVSPNLYGDVVTFLGLDKATGACGLTTTSTGGGPDGGATGGGGATGAGGAGAGTGGMNGTTGAGGTAGTGMVTGRGGSNGTTGAGGSNNTTTGAGGSNTTSGAGGAGTSTDGGMPNLDTTASGGCACGVTGARGGGALSALLLAAAIGLVARRRRR